MKTRQLTTIEKSTILGLHNVKVSCASFARQLSMPKTIVYIVLKNFHMRGMMQSLKSIRKLPKLNICDKREFGKILMQNS